MNRSKLAVIIPAWNERDTIGNVVRSVIGISTPIVVNDCSKDSTATEAAEAGAIVVNHEVNHGYDGALNSGFQKAAELGFEYAITFDADGQHDADLLRQFYMLLLNGNDLVLGIRPFFPRFSEFIFSLVSRFTLGVRDPLCGMKGYRMDLFHRHGCFDSCKSIGTELALWSCHKKHVFVQIPVPIHKRMDNPRFGKKIQANVNIFCAIIRVTKTIFFDKEGQCA